LQPTSHPALPFEGESQVASQEQPSPPTLDAPSTDCPLANTSNISPRAKFVFLLAIMFVSYLELPAYRHLQNR